MADAEKPKKKKKKTLKADLGPVKVRVRAGVAKDKSSKKAKGAKSGKSAKATKGENALEALAKLAESPIVADIIAVGATAAVAALAERGLSKNKASGNAVKNAGKAAAAAIGRRLMEEFDAVKQSAKDAPKA